LKKIKDLNSSFGFEKIKFYGTKKGEDFDSFLFQNDIGISLIDTSNKEICNNSFPSKMMVYLSHGLRVVSTRCESIVKSEVSTLLDFCHNEERDIAKAIKEIDLTKRFDYKDKLISIENNFLKKLKYLIEGKKGL
jgi:hypothetical protein